MWIILIQIQTHTQTQHTAHLTSLCDSETAVGITLECYFDTHAHRYSMPKRQSIVQSVSRAVVTMLQLQVIAFTIIGLSTGSSGTVWCNPTMFRIRYAEGQSAISNLWLVCTCSSDCIFSIQLHKSVKGTWRSLCRRMVSCMETDLKEDCISIEQHLWPNAIVPYTFGSGISGEEEQNSANIPEKSCMLHKLVILK